MIGNFQLFKTGPFLCPIPPQAGRVRVHVSAVLWVSGASGTSSHPALGLVITVAIPVGAHNLYCTAVVLVRLQAGK